MIYLEIMADPKCRKVGGNNTDCLPSRSSTANDADYFKSWVKALVGGGIERTGCSWFNL